MRKLATYSVFAPLIGITMGVLLKPVTRSVPPLASLVGLIQLMLILSGLTCGIIALVAAMKRRRAAERGDALPVNGGESYFGRAVVGVCLNVGFMLLVLVLLDALDSARRAPERMLANRAVDEQELEQILKQVAKEHADKKQARLERVNESALPEPAVPSSASPSPSPEIVTPAAVTPERQTPSPTPKPATRRVTPPPGSGPSQFAQADPRWHHPNGGKGDSQGEFTLLDFHENKEVNDATMELLATIPTLKNLSLRGTSITDAGLAHLSSMPALEVLTLYGTAVTDSGMPAIARSNVRSVDLQSTAITDAGLAELVKSPSIKIVQVTGTKITPAGVLAAKREGLTIWGIEPPAVATATPQRPPPAPSTPRLTPPAPGTGPVPDPARPPRQAPDIPKAPASPPPTAPKPKERTELASAESRMRFAITGIRVHATRNDKKFPASLDEINNAFFRDEHRTDHWGDAYLYLGAGRIYDPFDKSRTLLLATAKPHDGQRVVAYTNGKIDVIDEATFEALNKK